MSSSSSSSLSATRNWSHWLVRVSSSTFVCMGLFLQLGETHAVSTSKLQVIIPKSLGKADGYDHRDAMFGIPPYGTSIQQQLYYADSTLCGQDVDTSRGYPEREHDSSGKMKPWPSPFILMVDRGECTFVKKVRNAQRAGAAGVLIADNSCLCSFNGTCTPTTADQQCETQEPIMADDGSGADITIPSFLVFKQDADPIKAVLKENQQVRVEMAFSVPAPDSRVEYDLWTTPKDPVSRTFFQTFRSAVVALDKNAYFTPHMYVYDGVRAGCKALDTGDNECYNLCTNEGRYCAIDPDDDLDAGVSGADVVAESLRRMCIWNQYGTSNGIGVEWWKYVEEFMFRCDDSNNPEYFVSQKCIDDAMDHAGIDKDAVTKCMQDSGGVSGDQQNKLLEAELTNQQTAGVVLIPSLYINDAPVRGALSYSTAFHAICAGYLSGHEPKVCQQCVGCPDVAGCVENGGCHSVTFLSGSGVSVPVFAASIGVVCLVFLCIGVIQYRRQQRYMRDQVRGILAEYMPLDHNQMKATDTSIGIAETEDSGEFT